MIHEIVAGVLMVDGLVLGSIARYQYRKQQARLERCEEMSGEVVEIRERPGAEGVVKYPVIRYQNARRQEMTFESKIGSTNPKVAVGDHIEILVNPDNPTEAEVANFAAQWAVPLALGIGAVASFIGALVVFLVVKT